MYTTCVVAHFNVCGFEDKRMAFIRIFTYAHSNPGAKPLLFSLHMISIHVIRIFTATYVVCEVAYVIKITIVRIALRDGNI